MAVTAQQVSELRERTGVGLMDCKRVLVESDGDLDAAIKKLREKGLAKAAKKSDRSTNEGRIFTAVDNVSKQAVILELNCETDFVASNEAFSECGQLLVNAILASTSLTVEDLSSLTVQDQIFTDFIANFVLKLGENITVKQFKRISDLNYVSSYIHMNGKIGVLVAFSNSDVDVELATGIAMHVAAANPSYLNRDEVDSTELEKEREIIRAQALQEGKPENIIDKMVEGRIGKYYKEICLLEQAYIKDDKQSVQAVLGASSIQSFVRFSLSA